MPKQSANPSVTSHDGVARIKARIARHLERHTIAHSCIGGPSHRGIGIFTNSASRRGEHIVAVREVVTARHRLTAR